MLITIIFVVILIFGFVVFTGAPYVPSQKKYARLAFTDLYKLGTKDVLVDLGSGDGTILRLASKFGARSVGYEINPVLVVISRFFGRSDKLQRTELADMWSADLPADTTVIYVFSVTRDAKRLTEKIQDHVDKYGTEIKCITYGAKLKGKKPIKTLNAHSLYVFS